MTFTILYMFFPIPSIPINVNFRFSDRMSSVAALPLSSCGYEINADSSAWGELEDSSSLIGNCEALNERMAAEGYLYLRNFFPRKIIEEARLSMLKNLAVKDFFDPNYPIENGVLKPGINPNFTPSAAKGNDIVKRVVFGPEIKGFYETFLGGSVRHFDYIWVRAKGGGSGTQPHCDIVYMGRGTRKLYTAWIPYGDITYDIGGLMVLEKSHLQSDRLRNYLSLDVDTYCENHPERSNANSTGFLSKNPVSLREKLGGRWLSTEFQMGDLLTFQMDTVHASLDNHTDFIRLSTDTRYQLSSEPVDDRWVGENPLAHGTAGKRGRIC